MIRVGRSTMHEAAKLPRLDQYTRSLYKSGMRGSPYDYRLTEEELQDLVSQYKKKIKNYEKKLAKLEKNRNPIGGGCSNPEVWFSSKENMEHAIQVLKWLEHTKPKTINE